MDEAAFARLMDAYRAAVLAKDVDAFVALYDPDVRVFDLWGRWSYEGREAWREMVAGWFGSLGDERVEVAFDSIRTRSTAGLAVLHGYVEYRSIAADGSSPRAMHNRLAWTLAPAADGAAWRIVHEHTSAPADFETAKVVLER